MKKPKHCKLFSLRLFVVLGTLFFSLSSLAVPRIVVEADPPLSAILQRKMEATLPLALQKRLSFTLRLRFVESHKLPQNRFAHLVGPDELHLDQSLREAITASPSTIPDLKGTESKVQTLKDWPLRHTLEFQEPLQTNSITQEGPTPLEPPLSETLTLSQLFDRTLILTIAGIIDQKTDAFISDLYLKTRPQCLHSAVLKERLNTPECHGLNEIRTTYSTLPEFKATLHLFVDPWPSLGKHEGQGSRQYNVNTETMIHRIPTDRGQPQHQDWGSPQTYFQDHFYRYITNSRYICENYTTYQFFKLFFGEAPNVHARSLLAACPRPQQFYQRELGQLMIQSKWERMPFERLYQIHYLWAGNGSEASGKFGHAMIKLVFCSPRRKQVDAQCLSDISDHRIVSFAAETGIEEDALEGILGSYPMSLFYKTLASNLNQYRNLEFRDLVSIPLDLTPKQLEDLYYTIQQAIVLYEKDYRFFSNNCASATLRLLQSALFYKPSVVGREIIRPDTLRSKLIEMGIQSPDSAPKSGYWTNWRSKYRGYVTKSAEVFYQDHLSILKRFGILPPATTLEEYFGLPLAERNSLKDKMTKIVEGQIQPSSPGLSRDTTNKALQTAFISLEQKVKERHLTSLYKNGIRCALEKIENGRSSFFKAADVPFLLGKSQLPPPDHLKESEVVQLKLISELLPCVSSDLQIEIQSILEDYEKAKSQRE